jgi:oxygen-independent coproporphyrinogen III oxidase
MVCLEHGGIAESGSEVIDKNTLEQEFVFLNLRLRAGFQLHEFEQRFGETFDTRFGNMSTPLLAAGLLVRERDRICLSDRGLELADSVFAEFI